ncbi:hypothetical protein [Pantoea agglomerans]|uniref:hypothetical protein n=1 Tax=Enterobacter agglomerans TaxID=549 RepID=UPI003C7BA680
MSSLTPAAASLTADAARTRIASVSAITGSVTITAVFTPITAVAAISIAARTSIPSVSPVSVTATVTTVTTVATITVCPCRSAEYSGRQRGRYSEYDNERSQ